MGWAGRISLGRDGAPAGRIGGLGLSRQFSLSFMLFQVAWISIALGLFRAATQGALPYVVRAMFFVAGLLATGAVIGGLFGRMITGGACRVCRFRLAVAV